MQLRLRRHSYRFAEQVLNSKLALKEEIEKAIFIQFPHKSPPLGFPYASAPIPSL